MTTLNTSYEIKFPDYDRDVMETSDAKAIISMLEETQPKLNRELIRRDLQLSFLFPFVNDFMDKIETYKKQGYRLQSARELAFIDIISSLEKIT